MIPLSPCFMICDTCSVPVSQSMIFFLLFLIVCFTSYFVFSIAVLPHSPGVVYYHLLLRQETRIPGVAPFSFRIGIWDLFVHRGQNIIPLCPCYNFHMINYISLLLFHRRDTPQSLFHHPRFVSPCTILLCLFHDS